VRELRNEQLASKNRIEQTLPSVREEKHRQRNGGHARTSTGLYVEEKTVADYRSKPSNQLGKYKEK
jgi:hypothetical protein